MSTGVGTRSVYGNSADAWPRRARARDRLAAGAAGRRAARDVHALSGDRDALVELLFDAEEEPAVGVDRPRPLSRDGRRPGLLAVADEQSVVRARDDPDLDRPRAGDGPAREREAAR